MEKEINKNNEAREKRIKLTHYLWALIKEPYVFLAVLFLIILIFSAIFAELILSYDPLRPNIMAARLTPFSESYNSASFSSRITSVLHGKDNYDIRLLKLQDKIEIKEVDSGFFSKEYFAKRPESEKLMTL